MDVIPKLPSSGGYTKISTVMDVSLQYFFTYLVFRVDAPTSATVIMHILSKDTYLRTKSLTDMDHNFCHK